MFYRCSSLPFRNTGEGWILSQAATCRIIVSSDLRRAASWEHLSIVVWVSATCMSISTNDIKPWTVSNGYCSPRAGQRSTRLMVDWDPLVPLQQRTVLPALTGSLAKPWPSLQETVWKCQLS